MPNITALLAQITGRQTIDRQTSSPAKAVIVQSSKARSQELAHKLCMFFFSDYRTKFGQAQIREQIKKEQPFDSTKTLVRFTDFSKVRGKAYVNEYTATAIDKLSTKDAGALLARLLADKQSASSRGATPGDLLRIEALIDKVAVSLSGRDDLDDTTRTALTAVKWQSTLGFPMPAHGKEGVRALFEGDGRAYDHYAAYAKKTLCAENLEFISAARTALRVNTVGQLRALNERFVAPDAEKMVNLKDSNSKAFATAIAAVKDLPPNAQLPDSAMHAVGESMDEIYGLMSSDNYARYLKETIDKL